MMKEITLPHRFTPRIYQIPLLKALDSGIKRAVVVAHRRSGKDKTCLNLMIKKMVERVGVYYYIFPTFAQAKKVIWDGIDGSGMKFLDHFPAELIVGKPNDTELKIKLKNGSLFQLIGSDQIDSIMGPNPIGLIFSEYSLQDPRAWGLLRPILAENGGWAIFIGTPRGENHFYELYELAKNSPAWFSQILAVGDTNAIRQDILDTERAEVIKLYGNDSLYMQEWECDFSVPISGAYYAEQISQAYKEGRVGHVPHEPVLAVDTWWDLGIDDSMTIWFTQSSGSEMRVIDYLEDTGKGLTYYIQKLKEKTGYIYGTHTAPHDINVRELSSGNSRKATAVKLGIDFMVAPRLSLGDGIDACRNLIPKCWFDKEKCRDGLNALKNYRKTYDTKKRTYVNQPLHDWASHGADGFRTCAVGVDPTKMQREIVKKDKYARGAERQTTSFNPMTV